jgi:LmbE family N-acetylglucosaminyl deacetylase
MSSNDKNIVLVVAPHPDDESLGCGGTLLKHKLGGDETIGLLSQAFMSNMGSHEIV